MPLARAVTAKEVPRGWRYAIPILSAVALVSVLAVATVGPLVLLALLPLVTLVLAGSSMIADDAPPNRWCARCGGAMPRDRDAARSGREADARVP